MLNINNTMSKLMVVTVILLAIFLLRSPSSLAVLLNKLQLPPPVIGPESLAFDSNGGGPYVTSSDGRIFKYVGPSEGFKEYAYTSPNRNRTICDGFSELSEIQAICGRPLGLGFNHQTGDLYAADGYYGLVKVGPNGGQATQLVGPAKSNSTVFANALDVDPNTGIVYFTIASTKFQPKDFPTALLTGGIGDNSGSLLSYDPSNNQTTVLLRNLTFASGVAVSGDGSFVLVSEYFANRIRRVWLKGPKANSSDLFMLLAGRPDNIKRNSRGQFWIAVNSVLAILSSGVRVNENGLVLQILSLVEEYGLEAASEVQEYNGTLYGGSLLASYAIVFTP